MRASRKNCSTSLAHFGGQLRARFVQAQHDAGQLQPLVEPLVHQADRFEQLAQAVQREEVRLQRQEHIVDRGQRVDREDAQRRRAIDEHVVELVGGLGQLVAQDHFAADDAGQLDFGGGQVDVRGGDDEVFFRTGCHAARAESRCFLGEQIVDGRHLGLRVEAQVQRGVRLRVDVDQAHALPGARQRGARGSPRSSFCRRRLSD